jgi:putative hydrolase of HD superfamily
MKNIRLDKFLSYERKLDTVIRFSAQTRIKDESVAEHSFHTAFYAMILADMEEQFGGKIDKQKVLKTALIHDLEECLTGDIIYTFKHTHKSLTKEIRKMSLKFLEELLSDLPEKLSKEYIELWKNQKDEKTKEGKIIEAADKLEGLIYSLSEVSLGNKSFKAVIGNYVKHLRSLKLRSVNLILEQLKTTYEQHLSK